MATRQGILDEMAANGVTDQTKLVGALASYREKHGDFDDEIDNRNVSASVTAADPRSESPADQETDVFSEADTETERLRTHYDIRHGEEHPDEMLFSRLEEEYGTNATPKMALEDIADYSNHPQTSVYKPEGKNPKTFMKLVMGNLASNISRGVGAIPEATVRTLTGYGSPREQLKIADKRQARQEMIWGLTRHGLSSEMMDLFPVGFFDEKKQPTLDDFIRMERSGIGRKALGMSEAAHDTAREFGDYLKANWEYGIDPSFRGSKFEMLAHVPAEIMQLPFYMVPGFGTTYAYGRLFDEAQTEMLGAGYSREDSSNFAFGYMMVTGPIEVFTDKITLGVGSDLFRSIKPKTPAKAMFKAAALTSVQSQKAGLGELATETFQSAYTQIGATGEVDWNQAWKEGLIGYLSGVVGGESFGKIRMMDSNNLTRKIRKLGVDTEEAVDFTERIQNSETAAEQKDVLKELNIRILMERGRRIRNATGQNTRRMVPKLPKDTAPFTYGEAQGQRKANTDAEIDRIVDGMDESLQPLAREVFKRPTRRGMADLNKKIDELAERREEMRPSNASRRKDRRKTEQKPVEDPKAAENGAEQEDLQPTETPDDSLPTSPEEGHTDEKEPSTVDFSARHAIGSKVRDGVYGDLELKARWIGEDGQRRELWIGATQSLFFTIDEETGQRTDFKAGDGRAIGMMYQQEHRAEAEARQDRLNTEQLGNAGIITTDQGRPITITTEIDTGPSVFSAMSTTDLADYWASNIALGFGTSPQFETEVMSRFDNRAEFQRFYGMVQQRAEAQKVEVEASKESRDEFEKALGSIARAEVLTVPKAIELYESALTDFERLIRRLEFELLPGNEFYRNAADEYARKSGQTSDYELNWLGPTNRRRRAMQLYERFGPIIMSGDTAGVDALLVKEKISPNGIFGFGVRYLSGRVRFAQSLQARETGRVETHGPREMREDVDPYELNTDSDFYTNPYKIEGEIKPPRTTTETIDELITRYIDKVGAPDTTQVREQISMDFASLEQKDDSPDVSLFPELSETEAIQRKEMAKKAMSILRAAYETQKPIPPEHIDFLNDVMAAGAPVSLIVKELYTAPEPFSWPVEGMSIQSPADVHASVMQLRSPYNESLKRLVVNKDGVVIEAKVLSYGSINSSIANAVMIYKDLPEGTAGVILAHNHPSGSPDPSGQDFDLTKALLASARSLGIPLLDHVVTDGRAIFSMRDQSRFLIDDPTSEVPYTEGMEKWELEGKKLQLAKLRFPKSKLEYAKDRDPAAVDAMRERIRKNALAPWETLEELMQPRLNIPGNLYHGTIGFVRILRQTKTPECGHAILMNSKSRINGIHRFDLQQSAKAIAQQIAAVILDQENVVGISLDLPMASSPALALAKMVRDLVAISGVHVHDVIDSSETSLRDSGAFTARIDKDFVGWDMVSEEAAEYDPGTAALEQIEADTRLLENEFLQRAKVELLEDLTALEAETAMRYAAWRQEYDETIDEVPEVVLPDAFVEFLTSDEGWVRLATEISDEISTLKEALGIDFEAVAGFYFPLRHMADPEAATTTIQDMIDLSLGVAAHRTGTFEGVILNPETQIRMYLRDAARLISVGRAIANQRYTVEGMIPQIAKAMYPDAPIDIDGDEDGHGIVPSPEAALSEWEKLRALEAEGKKLGIDGSEIGSTQLFRMVAMLAEDGGGAQVPNLFSGLATFIPEGRVRDYMNQHGRDWSAIVDPSFIVQRMDGMKHGKAVDGRMYGANSTMLAEIFQAGRLMRDAQLQNRQDQRDLISSYKDEPGYKRINRLLHDLLIKDPLVRREVMNAQSPAELAHIMGLSEKDSQMAFYYGQEMRKLYGKRAFTEDMRSDVSMLNKDRRIQFWELERKIQEGVASEEDVNRYLSYIPKHKLDQAKPNSKAAYTYHSMMRNASRWFFERHAIDSMDFFGYFDSLQSAALKSDYLLQLYNRVNAWADYLETIGQDDNARWWRIRAESNIKGDLYAFEDGILDVMASVAKKVSDKKAEAAENVYKGSGQAIDALRNATPAEVKGRIIEAAGLLQKARIYNYLLGNIGWTLATQPTSMALTVRQTGFKGIFGAYHRILFGEADITESDVTMLKNRREGLGAIEAVSQFETLSVKHGLRSRARIMLGYFGEKMETHLTHVSYLAGYIAAKEKYGMDEDDARIHGDFVAATTQSMYDRLTRNSALNSIFLRAIKPMQTFAFTNFSNLLDTIGVVGIDRPGLMRIRELVQWRLAAKFFSVIWSMIFGDDLLKSLLDPKHDKATVGGHIPVFGDAIDRSVSEVLPWKQDIRWKTEWYRKDMVSPEIVADFFPHYARLEARTAQLAKAYMKDAEHKEREALEYAMEYITPWMGIGGGSITKNLISIESARKEWGRLEKVNGDKNKDLGDLNNPVRWAGGVMFGTKAVDPPESFKEMQEKKKARDKGSKKKRDRRF